MFSNSRCKIIDKCSNQPDYVKSGSPDKKSQCRYTSVDATKQSTTSYEKQCKRLAFMATLVRQSKVTSIDLDYCSPADYHPASKQNDSEQEYSSPPKSDRDSYQDDSSDNLGEKPETPPANSQNRWGRFKHRKDSPEDSWIHKNQIQSPRHDHQLILTSTRSSISLGVMIARTSPKNTKKDSFALDRATKQDVMLHKADKGDLSSSKGSAL